MGRPAEAVSSIAAPNAQHNFREMRLLWLGAGRDDVLDVLDDLRRCGPAAGDAYHRTGLRVGCASRSHTLVEKPKHRQQTQKMAVHPLLRATARPCYPTYVS